MLPTKAQSEIKRNALYLFIDQPPTAFNSAIKQTQLIKERFRFHARHIAVHKHAKSIAHDFLIKQFVK